MSIQSLQSSINSARNDIGNLQKRISDETKKESNLNQKLASLHGTIKGRLSPSSLQSKLRDISRLQDDIAKVQAINSSYQKKLADKTAQLHRYESDLIREQERERKKVEDADKRRQNEQLAYQRKLTDELRAQKRHVSDFVLDASGQETESTYVKKYDMFISHANEDKDGFVRPLAHALEKLGVAVWYDELQLKVGDSLRRSIDRGLANSRYGVVVLSSSFFAKNWPQYELDGMIAREMNGVKVVLPIWHKVSKDEVMAYSPSLADKVALNSSLMSIDDIAKQLADVANN